MIGAVQPFESMELRGSFTLQDHLRFQYFHSLRRGWLLLLPCVLIWLSLAAIEIASLLKTGALDHRTGDLWPALAVTSFWTFFLLFRPWFATKRLLKSNPHLLEPIALTFTEEGVSGQSEIANWSFQWKLLKQIRETRSLFLLYHSGSSAVLAPKHMFTSAAQQEEWRTMVSERIAPKSISRPGLVGRWI